MEAIIGRSAAPAQRIFPLPAPDLYQPREDAPGLTPDERIARRLLELGKTELGALDLARKPQMSSVNRIKHLMFYHRKAMEEELAGQPDRADFFWRELYHEFKTLAKKNDAWRKAVREIETELDIAGGSDPESLERRLTEEVFIDTHCAFYNGFIRQTDPIASTNRAFQHFEYIAGLLEYSTLEGESLRGVLAPAAILRMKACTAAGHPERAFDTARLLVKQFPDSAEYQEKLAEADFAATLARMSDGNSESSLRRDADIAEGAITRIEPLLAKFPDSETLHVLLGHLHHVRAIRLGNAGDLSEALLHIEKAVNTYPPSGPIHETREQLIAAMKSLQEQMSEAEAAIASHPNATLSAEGQRLQRQANRGFSLMNGYIESGQGQAAYERFVIAHARQLWRTIGLPIPPENWNDQALPLLDAVNRVFNEPPTSEADIAPRWRNIVHESPCLAALDEARVRAYLEQRLFRADEEVEASAAAGSPADPLVLTASAEAPPAEPFVLSADQSSARKSAEPFSYWLFSRQDRGLKAMAAAAILLVCLAAGLWLRESSYRRTRDAAFRQLIASKEQNRHPAVIEHAEAFLSHPPLGGEDGREDRVLEYYRESLVRWAIEADGKPNDQFAHHLNRYRQLAPTNR